ncbi:MAG: DegT/DnrJ/EryC1/StrS family aminotransferase [Magnetococcales bacterium]|nr:DegT/DnrJ/EryC1/StrS family aminotransferase [Magnetococcales bacterium]
MDAAIHQVVVDGDFILGKAVGRFEADFAHYLGVRHALGCASGTDALHLAFRALGVGPGDEVIMPAMTFVATALGISLAGATPVLADVDPTTGLMDPEQTERAVTGRTRALCPVHLYGQMTPMEPWLALARRHGLFIVEDAAQAHGATDALGRHAGSVGDIGAFSFYPGKNLGAYGDGGCVTTNDPGLADKIRLLRNWGSIKKYHHEEMGLNSRLDTIQAAVLGVKLPFLDSWNQSRRLHAWKYDQALAAIPGIRPLTTIHGSVHHLYVVRSQKREEHCRRLNTAGIGAGIHYPFAIHELAAYRHLAPPGAFPHAENLARQCLSLPIYAELPEEVFDRCRQALAASSAG